MRARALALALAVGLPPALGADGLDPALLSKPPVEAWPSCELRTSDAPPSTPINEVAGLPPKSIGVPPVPQVAVKFARTCKAPVL